MWLERLELDLLLAIVLVVITGGFAVRVFCCRWKGKAAQTGQMSPNLSKKEQSRKLSTEKKALFNQEVEALVRERTAHIQQLMEEMESFTATVAHDLKAPLRSIAGYSKFILEDYRAEFNEDLVQMVSNINTISNNTIALIDHLLQYSKTVNQELVWEEINPAPLIAEVFAEIKAGVSGRELLLEWETALPWIQGDRMLLKAVFTNILDNAVKFCRGRAKPVIVVGCRALPEEWQIYIRDNGVGFDMEYSGKLFGVFERLHTVEEFEGHGIGLATVKKIMQRHRGRVWIEGQVDCGATVYLVFPK